MSGVAVGLGEALLRLSPPGVQTFAQTASLDVRVGGAELNVLAALAGQGFESRWLTRLADNPLGHRIAAEARAANVAPIVDWDPAARAPLYFVEHGVAPRGSHVHYDRERTAMCALAPDRFDWPALVAGADIAVASGITSALGAGPAAAVTAFLAAARAAGARTAFDVNHRSLLWTWAECLRVVTPQLVDVDVLFANRRDLLGVLDATDDDPRDDATLARAVIDKFGVQVVVLRANTYPYPEAVEVAAVVVTADATGAGAAGPATVVDPFGAGDAGMAACLAALHAGRSLDEVAAATATASALHHTVVGDLWQLGALAELGSDPRRVQR